MFPLHLLKNYGQNFDKHHIQEMNSIYTYFLFENPKQEIQLKKNCNLVTATNK